MWMTGLVGMATKYSEAVLAVKYREKGEYGMRGGPMYYLAKGAGMPKLGWLFALFTALATFGIGNMTQANAVATIFQSTFNIEPWVTGTVLMLLTGLVIIGGIKSIGRFTSMLVPFMIACYVGAALVVLVLNAAEIPHALYLIFYHAFSPAAATGGFAGAAVAAAMRFGIARGVFSNESGLGSAPIAAAAARTKDPVRQGTIAMMGTFLDTIVVCTLTALVIVVTGSWTQSTLVVAGGLSGADLTVTAFNAGMPGFLAGWGGNIVVCSSLIFGFTTLIGWSYYGEVCFGYLFGLKIIKPYRLVFIALLFTGSLLAGKYAPIVTNVGDTFNALMALPNLVALLLLTSIVAKTTMEHADRS
jgi:AGCS family alanine or glycine:cation symporter